MPLTYAANSAENVHRSPHRDRQSMASLTTDVNVSTDLSPSDEMFTGDRRHYFSVGQSALQCIGCSLVAARLEPESVRRILDLPCGHGRVLRYLRAAFPSAEIIACDLQRDGVDYCARTFGAFPVYSAEAPEEIPVEQRTCDLIWVGSLLTHLDGPLWLRFFDFFRRSLRPGGVLVFTTHGRAAYDRMVRQGVDYGLSSEGLENVRTGYERVGFGYADYATANSYGISLSSAAWVFQQIASIPEVSVVHFSERAWDDHQDVYACVRDPDWQRG